ncbi:methyltransferase, partial [Verticiella sediminum]
PDALVRATDVNPAALLMTRVNARVAGIRNVQTQVSDLLRDVPGQYDLIVANPPYMRDMAGRAYRDGGGALGEGIALTIARTAPQRLAPGGSLLLYTGVAMVNGADAFLEAIRLQLADSGMSWSYEETDPDVFGEELDTPAYAGAERIATVVLRVDAAAG